MSFDKLLIFFALLYPAAYLSVLVHEFGHAAMGWICGFDVAAFGVGLGKPFLIARCGRTKLYFSAHRPFQGLAWALYPQIYPSRWAEAAWLAGGVLANSFLLAMTVLLWNFLPVAKDICLPLVVVNGIALTNLVPFAFPVGKVTLQSDGALILETLASGGPVISAPRLFETARLMASFWEAIGVARIHHFYLLASAQLWLCLGNVDQAQALWTKAESQTVDDPPFLRALAAAIGSDIQAASGNLEAGAIGLEIAGTLFEDINHEVGRVLVALGRCRLALHRGQADVAIAGLDPLASQPLIRKRPALGLALIETLLACHAAANHEEELQALLARYECMPRRRRSSIADLRIFHVVGAFHGRRGDWVRAESAYRQALEAAKCLLMEFADPADLALFRKGQEPLVAEARECWRRLGNSDESDPVDCRLPTQEELECEQNITNAERGRANHHAYAAVTVVNFVSGAVALAFARSAGKVRLEFTGILGVFGLVMLLFSILAALYLVFSVLHRRKRPDARSNGLVLFLLALTPWFCSFLIVGVWIWG
jgi:tetratricopeptide (TPR) repeat protein